MLKKITNFSIFFVFFFFAAIIFANINPPKGIFLKGKIESKVDLFGRRFFEGKIINSLDRRVDFVFIEFRIINKKNDLIEKIRSYVYGTVHIFKDSTVSTSSIETGKVANFKCFTSVMPDSIKKFDYNIEWKVFDELPEKY